MHHENRAYIGDILHAAHQIAFYLTGVVREAFNENPMMQDAVIRQIFIVGEAAGKLSASFRRAHSTIPWQAIVGMRNKITHDYRKIDLDIIWDTAHEGIQQLAEYLSDEVGV
jgi:uncharacterized protein with HEPN domain